MHKVPIGSKINVTNYSKFNLDYNPLKEFERQILDLIIHKEFTKLMKILEISHKRKLKIEYNDILNHLNNEACIRQELNFGVKIPPQLIEKYPFVKFYIDQPKQENGLDLLCEDSEYLRILPQEGREKLLKPKRKSKYSFNGIPLQNFCPSINLKDEQIKILVEFYEGKRSNIGIINSNLEIFKPIIGYFNLESFKWNGSTYDLVK